MVDDKMTIEKASVQLKLAGMRLSPTRIALYVAFKNNPCETYSDIRKIVMQKLPSLSMTTVYNNIKAFKKAGVL